MNIRMATQDDIVRCKEIVDKHRNVFGFLSRPIFQDAAERRRLLVALDSNQNVLGFVRFNHRVRGTETALYDICVDHSFQWQGIGRALISALVEECIKVPRFSIILRCPEGLPSNDFYQHIGFRQAGIEQGKRRNLVVWRYKIEE